ncbi:MAG TPA: 6-phosphogluconolactonase [Bryobacteraceae bacterium]|nr:6-phosphogluconolactonase [Bryobacteraceae bacterium]
MNICVFETPRQLAEAAAGAAAEILSRAIEQRERASLVVATGKSQIEFLDVLVRTPVDWSKIAVYQLDEYLGLPRRHPASLAEFIRTHLLSRVEPGEVHLLEDGVPKLPIIDAAFTGIGENGHLAFNDPPADFQIEDPYICVWLDQRCRRQQVGEGWFASMDDVPLRALSMSIRQIMKSREILCIAPERRKAEAVSNCFTGEVSPMHPASILQSHPHATVFLDADSASFLAAS